MQPIIDAAQVPTFAAIAGAQYDNLGDKWSWRTTPSDTIESKAMAYYAIQKGWTKCVLIFENVQSAQSYVQPITTSYQAHGGTVLANIQLVPHLSSYRSELVKAFAGNPQCVFIQTDSQTAGTLFADARQLGHMNVPFIGTVGYTDPTVAKAIGLSDFNKWVTGMSRAQPTGEAPTYFSTIYKAQFNEDAGAFQAAHYDAMIVAALAMTAANSTDPNVWVNKVIDVSSPPGTKIYTYAEGVAALKAGQKINYEGAASSVDFDATHSIITDFNVITFDTSSQQQTVFNIPAAGLAGY